MQLKQSGYSFAQSIIQLFKQRAKDLPDIDHHIESILMSSPLRHDYIQITDRISLTKKNQINNLLDILQLAKETAKYGVKIDYLEDINKTIQERLRVYMLDLNKYLREMYAISASIWNCFKNLKKKGWPAKSQQQQLGLQFYLSQIKEFKQDIENNKYYVCEASEVMRNQMKTQNLQASKQNAIVKVVSSSLESEAEAKEFFVNCLVKVLQSRKIQDLKLIEKEIECHTHKNEQLQLKRSLKLYIQEQIQRNKQNKIELKPTQTSLSALVDKNFTLQNQTTQIALNQFRMLKESNEQLMKQNLQLQKQIQSLKYLITTKDQNQIHYQQQLTKLKSQLENEHTKFTYLDRSSVSNLSQDSQLVTYHYVEDNRLPSPTTTLQQFQKVDFSSRISKGNVSPVSSKSEVVMECLQNYQQLEIRLNEQINRLNDQNNKLRIQIAQCQEQVILYKGRYERQANEKQNYKTHIQELLAHLQYLERKQEIANQKQTENFMAEKSAYQQRIQLLKIILEQTSNKYEALDCLNSTLSDKIQELEQKIDRFNTETADYNEQLNTKATRIVALQDINRQLQLSLEIYKQQISLLHCRINQLRSTLQKFKKNKVQQFDKQFVSKQQLTAIQQPLIVSSAPLSINSQNPTATRPS